MDTENFTEYIRYLRLALNSGSRNPALVLILYYKLLDFAGSPALFKAPSTVLFEMDHLHRNLYDRNEQLLEKMKLKKLAPKYNTFLEGFHTNLKDIMGPKPEKL